jgi:hypothetical protein
MFMPRAFDIAEIAKGLFGGAEQFAATSPAALSLKYGGHNRRMGLTAVLPRLPPAGVFLSGLTDRVAKPSSMCLRRFCHNVSKLASTIRLTIRQRARLLQKWPE